MSDDATAPTETTPAEPQVENRLVIEGESEADESGSVSDTDVNSKLADALEEIKQLRRESSAKSTTSEPLVLPTKPTLASCGYDEDKLSVDLEAWHSIKAQIKESAAESKTANDIIEKEWNAKQAEYNKAKKALGVNDADAAQAVVISALSDVQQSVILDAADNPALVVYALGKRAAMLAEIKKETNPIKFAIKIAKFEKTLSLTAKVPKTEPERSVRGETGRSTVAVDRVLTALRERAALTGDFSEVTKHLRSQTRK